MEAFSLLVLIVLAIVANNRFNTVKKLLENQKTDLDTLRTDLLKFRNELINKAGPISPHDLAPAPITESTRPVIASVVEIPAPPVVVEPEPEPVLPVVSVPIQEAELPPVATTPPVVKPQPFVPAEPRPSFFQRFLTENPDLEKFIGENLINKIGIAILVAGIGYFVKFAIDQQWINELGRVFIGILAGGLLLGVAHRIRHSFIAFSSVLVAGGLSVLYFTIAIAYSDYRIFSQTAAFVLMVIITGFSVLLAIAYNRPALAVMSLIGGFATPFMVSSGQGNYIILFTYLLVLDCGMLVLAYFKKWNIVHFVAYGFTVLLYSLWLTGEVNGAKNAPYFGALIFATLFYLVFMAMNLVYNLRARAKFSAVEISLLMSNTAFYYAAGMYALANVQAGAYQGLFTAVLALVNMGLAMVLYKREYVDRTLIYLLIGLVITFASLTIPVQLDGNFITMFWALEAVLLLWLSQRSGLIMVATASVLVTGLMLISLTMDWSALYGVASMPPLPVLFNKAFITSIVSIGGLLATYRLLRQQSVPFQFWLGQLEVATYSQIIRYLALITIYLSGAFELNYQLIVAFGFGANRTIILGTYNLFVVLGLLLIGRRYPVQNRLRQTAVLGILGLVLYVTLFSPAVLELLETYFQGTELHFTGYPIHYLSVAFVIGILFLLDRIRPLLEPIPTIIHKLWPWFLGFIIVYAASTELAAHAIFFGFSDADIAHQPAQRVIVNDRYYSILTQTSKVGLPILWGLCAFAFMYIGLNRRNRTYRILALSLFALTLIKLFFYDLQGISEGGKIAAFISLGALLLIISFMYQRIKRLILANDTNPPSSEL